MIVCIIVKGRLVRSIRSGMVLKGQFIQPLIMRMKNGGKGCVSVLLKGTEIVGLGRHCILHNTKNLTFIEF